MQDFDQQLQLAQQRRQQFAGQRDFQAPQGQMVGRHYVAPNPLEYLAAGLRSFNGIRGQDMAEQEMKDLQGGKQKAIAEALRNFGEMSQGRPAEVLPPEQAGPVRPAQAPDTMGAYQALMQAPDAALRQSGMQGIIQMPQLAAQQQERIDARDFRREEAQATRAARAEELQIKMQDARASQQERLQAQRELREMQIEATKALRSAGGQGGAQPYFQPVQTAQGVMAFNARTGRMEPIMGGNGQPVVGAQFDPALQGSLAGAKTGATTEAKIRTESRLDAPKTIAQADEAVRLVDDLLAAPGFKQAVGGSRMLGIQKIPGTSAKDFDVRLDQLKGKQFLQAFESLKGGGAITEIEGKKATDAIARMDAAGSEPEFTKAAREFQAVIRAGSERARAAASGSSAPAAPKPRLKFDAQGNAIP